MSDSLQPRWIAATRPPCPSPSPSLPKFMSTESVMPSNHLILCCPLLLLPSIFPSIRVFISSCQVAKALELQHQSFSEYSRFISFRIEQFELLAVQGTPKSLLKHISSLALCFLHCPDLTSLHHYWKDHRFDYIDLCQQSDVSASNIRFQHVNFVVAVHSQLQSTLRNPMDCSTPGLNEPFCSLTLYRSILIMLASKRVCIHFFKVYFYFKFIKIISQILSVFPKDGLLNQYFCNNFLNYLDGGVQFLTLHHIIN